MKKIVVFFVCFLAAVLLFSCGSTVNDNDLAESDSVAETFTETAAETVASEPELFPVRYIRTGSYRENVEFPYTVTIGSRNELADYISGTKNEYYSLSTGEFFEAVSAYDDEYFADNVLVFAVLQEGSGSNRHELVGVTADDIIEIKRLVPECGTCDMAEWHVILEMPRERVEGHSFTVEYYGEDNRELAIFAHNFIYMTARVPKGWTYEIREYDALIETVQQVGIIFYPVGNTDVKVRLLFYTGFLGMCGTGLVSEQVTLGKYSAVHHRYDNMNDWHLYFFKGVPGDYSLEISGVSEDGEYADDVREIIDTLTLAEGIDEAEAIELAEAECTVEYDHARASFDFLNGLWRVNFSKYDTAGGDQTVNIYIDGKVHSVEYGE